MTLKEELEILRGEPIQVFEGDPMDIPCIETSDAEKLCKNPVVSVHMITYNHEPYIRQAIEGVMMQKTDFEFELIIGEDCSQDKTREICFEYQKKYPDKIRVLWWHENVSKLGGNGRRLRARSRGEFIALCEGDDYWIDPLKLQKQVDAMRMYPQAGLCFCGSKIIDETTGDSFLWKAGSFPVGLMSGVRFLKLHIFGSEDPKNPGSENFIMTATTLFRKQIYGKVVEMYDVFKWRLYLGDTTLWCGLASVSDVVYLPECVSVYRKNQGGVCARAGGHVIRDASLVRLYYVRKLDDTLLVDKKTDNAIFNFIIRGLVNLTKDQQKQLYEAFFDNRYIRAQMTWLVMLMWKFALFRPWMKKTLSRWLYYRRNLFAKLVLRFKTH